MLSEALVAVGSLLPLIVVMIGIFPFAYSLDEAAAHRLTATDLAREALEGARASRFDDVSSATSQVVDDGTTYVVQSVVRPLPDAAAPLKKELTVTVRWKTGWRLHSVTVETVLPRLAS